ncbi:hypothetical protein GOV13_03480, partial [Candidatus Pacearchaeota archaeon]|nr:hypothetical protein [Candidatus Pacearchaeota archaeon]
MAYDNISFENFYEGGASSFNSEYSSSINNGMSASQMGFPGSPQTANQLGETVNALKQGVKAFEVTMLTAETAETIPTQHFSEMRALMKLSGVKPSVHGPLIDAAGFDEKGGWGGEQTRANNERRMFGTLEKAQVLGPDGNIPVVFHISNGAPGTEWMPGGEGEDRAVMNKGAAINRSTGEAVGIARGHMFHPMDPESLTEGSKGGLMTAEESVGTKNRTSWDKKLLEVSEMNKRTEDIIDKASSELLEYRNAALQNGKIVGFDKDGKKKDFDMITEPNEVNAYDKMRRATLFVKNAELSFGGAFN